MTTATESTITFNLDNLNDPAPLYYQYPQQSGAQPAYIEMDEDGNISADWNSEIGNGVPMTVWHNRTLRWPVSENANGPALAKLLRELAPEFEIVHSGHSVEWDGNNHVGRITDEADAARERIEDALREVAVAAVWSASDWLDGCPTDCLVDAGDTIAEAAAASERALDSDAYIDGGAEAIAEAIRERLHYAIDKALGSDEYPGTGSWDDYVAHYRSIRLLNGGAA